MSGTRAKKNHTTMTMNGPVSLSFTFSLGKCPATGGMPGLYSDVHVNARMCDSA